MKGMVTAMQNQMNGVGAKAKSFKKLTSSELTYFFEQISVFSNSGIATWESLSIIADNTPEGKQKELFATVFDLVSGGMHLSVALRECGGFPDYALGMIEIGEQTGRLQEVSSALADYYKDKDVLSQSIRSSVTYPLCMSAMVLVVIFVLLVQVMPVFEQVFAQLGLALNPVSSFLLDIGTAMNSYTIIILSVVAALVVIYFIMRTTEGGKRTLAKLYGKAPFTGKLFEAENVNHFAFSMSLMVGSGIDTLSALEFSRDITGSDAIRAKIQRVIDEFDKGVSLADAIITSGIFSTAYTGMLVAGMRSGTVDSMFMSIAERYHIEAQRYTQRLLSIIEPTLVAILCIVVGMVMLSVMLPLTGILAGM